MNGPFADWDECMAEMMKQYGDEETAKNVCGAFEQGYLPGSKSGQQEQEEGQLIKHVEPISIAAVPANKNTIRILGKSKSGKHTYMKVFLIDASINQNNWGVSQATIDRNIMTALGKPLVLYKNTGLERDSPFRIPGLFDHPPMDDSNLDHTYQMQDIFRIGTIIDLVKDSAGAWWGIVEITNPGVKKALVENPEIPFFLSPAIMTRDIPQQSTSLTDWVFVHIAMVSRPAFGATKAFVKGECSGDREACLLRLRKASVEAAGGEGKGCGFCTYKATKELGIQTEQNGSAQILKTKRVGSMANWADTEVTGYARVGGSIDADNNGENNTDGFYHKMHAKVESDKKLINNTNKSISSHVEKSAKNLVDNNLSTATEVLQNVASPNKGGSATLADQSLQQQQNVGQNNFETETVEEINELNAPDQQVVEETSQKSVATTATDGGANVSNNATNSRTSNNAGQVQTRTLKNRTVFTKAANTNNNADADGDLVTVPRSKLASLIREKNQYKQELNNVKQELHDSHTRIASLEAIGKVHARKLASVDAYTKAQRRKDRFLQIANFIAQAPVFRGLTPEEKDEQARNLAASNKTVQQIVREFEPLNKAALSAIEQGGSAAANVDEYGNITAGTSVPRASLNQEPEGEHAVMPFGGSGNYQTGRLVKTASARPQAAQAEEEKIPFALEFAMETLGEKGVEF